MVHHSLLVLSLYLLFSKFLCITWTFFRISFGFIYSIVRVSSLFCATFSVVALGITLYFHNLSVYWLSFYQFVVKCRNLIFLYVPLPSISNIIILNISSTYIENHISNASTFRHNVEKGCLLSLYSIYQCLLFPLFVVPSWCSHIRHFLSV